MVWFTGVAITGCNYWLQLRSGYSLVYLCVYKLAKKQAGTKNGIVPSISG